MSMHSILRLKTMDGAYKAYKRPLDKDLQVFKGFLLYCARMASKLKRVLEDDDIMTVITKFTFDCYLSSEAYRIDMLRYGQELK